MLLVLPPSETKREGGEPGSKLELRSLRFPQLNRARRTTIAALRELSRNREASIRALKLGPTQGGEVATNRAFTRSATLPAVDRYTGVLYDALDALSLPDAARDYLADHVAIHSAVLGPVGALDAVPAYRLSHDSRLPGTSLKRVWSVAVSAVLEAQDGLILDARSEAYAALGPAPARDDSVFLRVVTEDAGGTKRALNHFNKKAKGELVRRLALDRVDPVGVDELIAWGLGAGFRLERSEGRHGAAPGGLAELNLIV